MQSLNRLILSTRSLWNHCIWTKVCSTVWLP